MYFLWNYCPSYRYSIIWWPESLQIPANVSHLYYSRVVNLSLVLVIHHIVNLSKWKVMIYFEYFNHYISHSTISFVLAISTYGMNTLELSPSMLWVWLATYTPFTEYLILRVALLTSTLTMSPCLNPSPSLILFGYLLP